MSRVILCLEFWELCSLYVYIYIFCIVVSRDFFCLQSNEINIIFKQIYLTQIWDPNGYYHSEWTLKLKQWRGALHFPSSTELVSQHQMQFSVIPRTLLLGIQLAYSKPHWQSELPYNVPHSHVLQTLLVCVSLCLFICRKNSFILKQQIPPFVDTKRFFLASFHS